MKTWEQIGIGLRVLQAITLRKRIPLAVNWNLTHRCNLKCSYCGVWNQPIPEMNTEQVLSILDELAECGTHFINLNGGEPLLRDDLQTIIGRCKEHGMHVGLFSNGTLIARNIDWIQGVDEVQLSLDGPPEVNDIVRGDGVHDSVLEAIDILKKNKIDVTLSTVVTQNNPDSVSYMLDLGLKKKAVVYFHPADSFLSGNTGKEMPLAPEPGEFQRVMEHLIQQKRAGHPAIANTVSGLQHLSGWPIPRTIPCLIRYLYCSIGPDGRMVICDQHPTYEKHVRPMENGFRETFEQLSIPSCRQCWCGSTVEFNLVGRLRLDTIHTLWRRFRHTN